MNRGKYRLRGWVGFLALVLVAVPLMWTTFGAKAAGADDTIRLAALTGSDSTAAPDFELKDLTGSSIRLSSFKGKEPVMLYFWASWCPYCMAVKPDVAKLREKIPANEMEILGINVGGSDSLAKVKRFMEEHPAPYPVLYDGDGKATRAYHVQGIPLFVVIDKEGNIAYRGNALPEDMPKYLK